MGSLKPRNINRAFGICYKISAKSSEQDRLEIIRSLKETSEQYILENLKSMFVPHLCDDRLMSFLFLYSEVASVMDQPVNFKIPQFLFSFLRTVCDEQIITGENPRLTPHFRITQTIFDFSSKRQTSSRENQLHSKCSDGDVIVQSGYLREIRPAFG